MMLHTNSVYLCLLIKKIELLRATVIAKNEDISNLIQLLLDI